jgi:hypothetical protein
VRPVERGSCGPAPVCHDASSRSHAGTVSVLAAGPRRRPTAVLHDSERKGLFVPGESC